MRQRYAARAGVSNTCSTRVSTFLGCRARNRTHVLSDTCSAQGRSRGREMEDSMSAAVAWDLTSGGRAARPRLRLVPTGPDVRPTHLRLNRRGRLAVTVVVLAAVLTVTVVLAAGSGAAEPVPQRTATVTAGQTLSEVAAAQLPDLPIARGGGSASSWSTTSRAPRSTPGRRCWSLPPADTPLQGQGPPWALRRRRWPFAAALRDGGCARAVPHTADSKVCHRYGSGMPRVNLCRRLFEYRQMPTYVRQVGTRVWGADRHGRRLLTKRRRHPIRKGTPHAHNCAQDRGRGGEPCRAGRSGHRPLGHGFRRDREWISAAAGSCRDQGGAR